MDVLARAVNAALFVSHGIRADSSITLHLMGGAVQRRIRFDGSSLRGVHPDERSISGHIRSIMKSPVPPIGTWQGASAGIAHSGGSMGDTLREWQSEGVKSCVLDVRGDGIERLDDSPIGFVLSDHLPFTDEENTVLDGCQKVSLGPDWLQGHACIAIVHHLLDA